MFSKSYKEIKAKELAKKYAKIKDENEFVEKICLEILPIASDFWCEIPHDNYKFVKNKTVEYTSSKVTQKKLSNGCKYEGAAVASKLEIFTPKELLAHQAICLAIHASEHIDKLILNNIEAKGETSLRAPFDLERIVFPFKASTIAIDGRSIGFFGPYRVVELVYDCFVTKKKSQVKTHTNEEDVVITKHENKDFYLSSYKCRKSH